MTLWHEQPWNGPVLERTDKPDAAWLEKWRPQVRAGKVRLLIARDYSHAIAVPA